MTTDFTHRPAGLIIGTPDLLDPSYLGMPVVGNKYYLDPTNGKDSNSGLAEDDAFATLPTAYAALTANQHDVLYYIAGTSSISLSAAFTWAKSYTHFIGIGAPSTIANRCRIFQTATATGLSPLITWSATGCICCNIYTFQGVADATSLGCWSVTGGRNVFLDMHFAGGGHDTMAIDNCYSLFLNGAEENRFINCTVGVDTIALGNGGNALRYDGSALRNIFRNCRINVLIDNGGARLAELVDATAVDRINWFYGCEFFSNSVNKATPMASAFEIPASHTTTATIYLDPLCRGIGFTDWDDDDRGILYLGVGTSTGGGNSGLALVSAAT
jgi:hypothetical protein